MKKNEDLTGRIKLFQFQIRPLEKKRIAETCKRKAYEAHSLQLQCTQGGWVVVSVLSSPPVPYCPSDQTPAFLELSVLPAGGQWTDHTWADDSCILAMITVVLPPAFGRAPPHVGLLSCALHIVQPNGPWSHPKVRRDRGVEGFSTALLSAYHAGIVQVSAVTTDGAPGALVEDLHSPGAGTAPVHQAELSAIWGERNGTHGALTWRIRLFCPVGPSIWAVGGALLRGCRPCWFWYGVFALVQKAMATHSSTLAWTIPWTEEPGRLQSMGSLRVGHDWSDLTAAAALHWGSSWVWFLISAARELIRLKSRREKPNRK